MGYMYVNTPVGETVNVRKSASTTSAIVTRLSRGTRVTTDFFDNAGFWHITAPVVGYIMDDFLSYEVIDSGSSSSPNYPYDAFSAYGPSTQVLRRGSQGTAVNNLQVTLNALGYLHSNDGHPDTCIDGSFGPNTESAVIDYQGDPNRNHNLEVDGIVGTNTKNALWNDFGRDHADAMVRV